MKTVICFTAAIFLLTAFVIQVQDGEGDASANKRVTFNRKGLTEFRTYTGKTFGDAQLRSLINFINNASNLYTDVGVQLNYIKTIMDASYGDLTHQYSLVMEYVPVRDFGSATIYCEGGTNFAFIGYGVNTKYPTYTYLAYRLNNVTANYNYINYVINRGTGLTADQGNKISFIIQNVDGAYACDCSNTDLISDELEKIIATNWNVVCQSTSGIYSYVAIYNSTWIMVKPATCTYFIYAVGLN